MADPIRFYSVGDDYGAFSNFAAYPIVIAKQRWSTSEHYFQAQKFLDPKDQERVRSARTPSLAAREGRDRRKKLRRDWEAVKTSVMRLAVEAKFRQHTDLATLLLSTGNAELVEHTADDDFWGDGGDGSGRNMLGRILMDVRELLRSETPGAA
jgi:N-glycosidase YbiA